MNAKVVLEEYSTEKIRFGFMGEQGVQNAVLIVWANMDYVTTQTDNQFSDGYADSPEFSGRGSSLVLWFEQSD